MLEDKLMLLVEMVIVVLELLLLVMVVLLRLLLWLMMMMRLVLIVNVNLLQLLDGHRMLLLLVVVLVVVVVVVMMMMMLLLVRLELLLVMVVLLVRNPLSVRHCRGSHHSGHQIIGGAAVCARRISATDQGLLLVRLDGGSAGGNVTVLVLVHWAGHTVELELMVRSGCGRSCSQAMVRAVMLVRLRLRLLLVQRTSMQIGRAHV